MEQKKLTADEITTMHYANKVAGDTQASIARRYNVSQGTVSRYVSQIEEQIQAMKKQGRDSHAARMEAYDSFKRTY